MSSEPDIDPGGPLDGDELFVEQVDPSTSGQDVGQHSVGMPHYMVTEDNVWVQPLSDIIYQEDISTSFEDIQYEELQTVDQQILSTGEEIYFMPDEDRDFNEMRESVESLQVAAHEVVVDEMMQPEVEPTEYVQSLPRQVVRGMPTYVRTIPQHAVRPAPSQLMTMPGSSRVRYIVQQTPQPYGVQQSQHVQYDMRPKAMFEGPSNQAVIPVQQRPAPAARSRSKSQPRRPIFGDLEDDEMAYLVQEYDEGEWDGVELEDHEYFVGERAAIMAEDDEAGSSSLPAIKMQQRPYFPPNLTPTEKKEYLLVNYKKACERYFPFANVAMLEADTIYKPVEAFASDLYRFHSRGAHIHGFFRTVIDTRDPPSHDQTRYIQDIQFGKVFPLFPDYEEWDDKMRDEFRQLTSRLLRVFERKHFYANAGGGHGQAPAVKRGPKPQPKPPRDYAEQQKVGVKSIPKGFQAVRASTIQTRGSSSKPVPQATVISQPVATATRLTQVPGSLSMNEHVVVPDEVGAARVEAFEHNKRADVKRMVNDAFVARDASPHYVEYEAEPSNPRTFMCRVPPGPSKTLRHQRSTGSKAMRLIHNRAIEPTIDPVTGRYVVSLEDIRSHVPAPTPSELARYVQRPVHTLREMADSARRGAPSYATHAVVRPQGARISRIDQAPRFSYNGASMATSQHHLSTSSAARAPLLRNATGASNPRMTGVLPGNDLATEVCTGRNEHVYPRSHSSGRTAQPPSSTYRRSASSGRPADPYVESQSRDVDEDPYIQVDDDSEIIAASSSDAQDPIPGNQVSKHSENNEPALSAVSGQPRMQETDQNTAPANAAADAKAQKRTVLLRDEKGRLRRGIKLPDGTILLRMAEERVGVETKTREPTAGGVYAMHSMGRKDEKKMGRRGDQQWKRLQAPVTPWNHPSGEAAQADAHTVELSSSTKIRNRRKDLVQSEDDDDIVLISETRQGKQTTKKTETGSKRRGRRSKAETETEVQLPKSRSHRRPKLLTRHCPVSEAVPHRAVSVSQEKQQTFLRNRLLKQEEEDEENVFVDVVSVDSSIEDSVRQLIASFPAVPHGTSDLHLQTSPDANGQHDVNDSRERKKAGRPHKKFRGRLAKQKQAIRDAELAEKVAIKHRELPVLDLTLKVIDDPTVEIPIEAPIVLDPSIAVDAALLHEVGEVLKEVVAQVSLEELEPKRDVKSRSRRNWNYLPERVRSKRQEYKNHNVPVSERSPPPPPLKPKPRGRNSEKYKAALAGHHQDLNVAPRVTDAVLSHPPSGVDAVTSHSKDFSALQSQQNHGEHSSYDSPATDFLHLFDVDHNDELQSVPEVLNNVDRDFGFEHDPGEHTDVITRGKDDLAISSAEESLNDEDLVDVNVDTFFSDSFNVSTSGDEEETPSQKLRKWQECINDVILRTPISSPSKTKQSGADKTVRQRIIDSPRICSQDVLLTDQVEVEVKLVVEALITTVAFGDASGEIKMSCSYSQETAIPYDKRHSDTRDSGDVCHMVETIIDALELSLKTSELASPGVEQCPDIVQDVHIHHFQSEEHVEASASFIASNSSLEFGNVPVGVLELGVENVVAMIEEDLAKEDRRISAIEQELIADSLMFEAQRQAQQSSSSQSFAAAVFDGDRLDIAADVNVSISPLTDPHENMGSSASHCFHVSTAEQANLIVHWEENSTEVTLGLEKKSASGRSGCDLSIALQEIDELHVVDMVFSLSPTRTSFEDQQTRESMEKENEQMNVIIIQEPPVLLYEKCLLDVSVVDCAFGRIPLVECDNTSVCISLAEEDNAVFSLVETEYFFSRHEQSQESEKICALARVGGNVQRTATSEVNASLDIFAACQPSGEALIVSSELMYSNFELPKEVDSVVRDVVEFLVRAVEHGLHTYIFEGTARTAAAEVYLDKTVQTAKCIFRRRFLEDDSLVEYGICAKRRRSAFAENNQSMLFHGIGDESIREFDSLDTPLSQSLAKVKSKRRRRRRDDLSKRNDFLDNSPYPTQVSKDVGVEVNYISEYLRSEDQPNTGFSSLTHLESSFLNSPDLFGYGEDRAKRRSKSKKEKRSVAIRKDEVVTRSKAKALAATSSDKPRIIIRIKKHPTGAVIQRSEPDDVFGKDLGFFGYKLSNLVHHLKERQFERSFFTSKGFGSVPKRSAYDNIKFTVSHDSLVFTASRNRNHLISDFNLTMVRPRNPIVRFDADMTSLMTSMTPASPIRLSLPRAEGSLEHAVEQFEKGIGCVLDQVDNARKFISNLRDVMHWSLHFLVDAQLFLLDMLYELWGFTARTVQIAVFSVYQTCLWEKHSELFDARMYCLLFELNASAALSCNVDTCASYLRRFEDWCRKSGNYTSIYNHVHGMALSLIKLVAVPDALKRLQQMTLWNSKSLPSRTSEEVFSMDLAPFFQVGTCPFEGDDFDLEKVLNARMNIFNCPLESLIGFGAAQDNNRSDAFSFLFPSHAVVELCRKQIFKEIETYYHKNDMKSILSLSNRDLYVLSPIARGYFVSRVTESRAQGHMRNHVMNLEKLIGKLNAAYTDLKANVEMLNQAEFNYPCGQVVFGFESGTVNVCINKPAPETTLQPSAEEMEEARRIMGNAVDNTVFHPSNLNARPLELSIKSHRMKKSVEAVRQWVASIQNTAVEDIENLGSQAADIVASDDERMEVVYPNSPARVQVIDDEDDDTELSSYEAPTRKCCDTETITTVIAGRKIQYAVDCEQGFLKMKTMDSIANDDSTDDLTATNTFSTASFNSFDQIETLRIIRSKETGELDWMAMIQNALEAAPPPETLPGFMLKKEPVDYKTLDVMKLHEHANHFVHETDEDGEFLDQRKEMREKIKPFQRVDYFERRRNARFEQLKSSTPLEMPRPGPGCLDQLPAYGIWVHQVVVYAELEKKRLMALKPIDNVGRCRAARSEMIRGFSVPSKQRKRSASAVYWLGRTMREHFGEYIEFGMSRLQYEKAQSGKERNDARGFGSDDVITDYFVSRNNTPTTLVDPLELVENPYSYFRPTNMSRKRHLSPLLLESSLVKRFPECPVFAPFAMPVDEPETLYPPLDPNVLTSDDDDDD